MKVFFKAFLISVFAGVLMIGMGYMHFKPDIQNAQNDTQSVPYYSETPENAGVMVQISQSRILFYLDFKTEAINVIYIDDENYSEYSVYGYGIDYNIQADYDLLAGIVDIVGGIDLAFEQEILCCTGVQVAEMLEADADTDTLKREVTQRIIEKIGINGFERLDFLFIIQNSETDITMHDIYRWPNYIKQLCQSIKTVN